MLKKSLKIILVIVIIWMISLWTIVKEYKYGNITGGRTYEQALKIFRKKYSSRDEKPTESAFKAWHLLEPTRRSLTNEDKLGAVKSYSIPPGMNGTPVILDENLRHYIRLLINKGWENHAFNQFVSDLIPLNRTLPDPRDDWCKRQKYSNLLNVSIIICFHNEAWSTLLRTLHSVLNKTPDFLIHNIILFDDYSTMDHLKESLDRYIQSIPKVVLVRSAQRKGLARSRILALKYTQTPVIVYLDSHCECAEGWLEPLLERINLDAKTVVSPVVDIIHDSTFEYIPQDIHDLRIGGFNWNLKFVWSTIPREVIVKRNHPAAPVETPTISGGLFAIHKDFFKDLGFYDEGFEIWGGENLELSFKTWMCGGSLEIVPCSHVGHVFRKRMPYKGPKGTLTRNLMRLAEVWVDDYAKYFYERIGNQKLNFGNVTNRKILRKKLNCYSFEWYLKNIYPQLELPGKYVASGRIYSLSHYTMCMDAMTNKPDIKEIVNLLPCHFQGGNQTQQIRHMETQKCLQIAKTFDGIILTLKECRNIGVQKWMMENYSMENLGPELRKLSKRQFEKAMVNYYKNTVSLKSNLS